jgi:hypothetical protein
MSCKDAAEESHAKTPRRKEEAEEAEEKARRQRQIEGLRISCPFLLLFFFASWRLCV